MRPGFKTTLKLAISAGLVVWLVREADRSALRAAIANVDAVEALVVVVLLFALTVVQAWRWTVVAGALGIHFPLRSAWTIALIGSFFNQVLPSSVGGDAARVYRLRRAGLRIGAALNSVLVDRFVALLGTLVIVSLGLPLLFRWIHEPEMRLAVVGVAAAGLAGLSLLTVVARLPFVRNREERRAVRALAQLSRDARGVLKPSVLVPALLISLVIHTGVSTAVWRLAAATGVELAFVEAAILVPLVILFSMIPITIAGWGVREGAMVVALGTVAVDGDAALALSLLFGLASAVASLPGGLVWLMTRSGSAQPHEAVEERVASPSRSAGPAAEAERQMATTFRAGEDAEMTGQPHLARLDAGSQVARRH